MAQVNTNILPYAQAVTLLAQIEKVGVDGSLQSVLDLTSQLQSAITQFEAGAGQPLTQFAKVEVGEPPLSDRINQLWANTSADLNIVANQVDILRAAAVILYNTITTEMSYATSENGEIANLVSTLALYTHAVDSKTLTFGDQFASGGFIDTNFSLSDSIAQITHGSLTLAQTSQSADLTQGQQTKISILPQSNGFPGNNQEINDPSSSSVDSLSGTPQYTFASTAFNPNNPSSIVGTNAQPNAIFEYENYLVTSKDRAVAANFNFTYAVGQDDPQYPNAVNNQVDWASGPSNGYLDLVLQIDLGQVQVFNSVTYSPYGLPNDSNGPVEIMGISASADGSNWTKLLTGPIWVGTVVNQTAAAVAPNVSIGTQTWHFNQQSAQYVQIEVRQPNPIPCNIGHVYYEDSTSNQRIEGPVPNITNPVQSYVDPNFSISGESKNLEYFVGQRWVIGINDIVVGQTQYQPTSTMVTKRIYTTGVVDRVALDADVFVPSDFDASQSWATFWISPDDGASWYQIAPIEDPVLGVLPVIAFNDPLPTQFREPNVLYVTTDSPVTFLRAKIELSRPTTNDAETPVVRDYALRIRLA